MAAVSLWQVGTMALDRSCLMLQDLAGQSVLTRDLGLCSNGAEEPLRYCCPRPEGC